MNKQKFFTRLGMLAVIASLVLPMSAFAQGNRRGRDNRDDNIQRDRDRDGIRNIDELRRRQAAAEAQRQRDIEAARQRELEAARRQRDNDSLRRNQGNDDWRRRNDNNNDRNRRGRNWGGYGSYGGSFQLRQTALNAGYNNGIQEGRKDRNHGDRFEYRDEGDYQSANEDYNSRFGDRELYRRYFREGFANGYRDGYNGY